MSERLRVTDGVVAIYRPGPVRNPWHCYNTYDGSFIECRTDEAVARYRELPPTPPATEGQAGSGEAAPLDFVERCARAGAQSQGPESVPWEEKAEWSRNHHRRIAAAVLAEARASEEDTAEVLAGLREEMQAQLSHAGDHRSWTSTVWDEAIALVEAARERLADREEERGSNG